MKRLLAILCAAVMLLALSACGNGAVVNSPSPTGGNESSPSPEAGDENSPSPAGDVTLEGDGYTINMPGGWERDYSFEEAEKYAGGLLKSLLVMKHPKSELTEAAKETYMSSHKDSLGFESRDVTVDGSNALAMFYWLDESEDTRLANYWIEAPNAMYSLSFTLWQEDDPDALISGIVDSMKFS